MVSGEWWVSSDEWALGSGRRVYLRVACRAVDVLERLLRAQVVGREVRRREVVLVGDHPRHGVLEPHRLGAVVPLAQVLVPAAAPPLGVVRVGHAARRVLAAREARTQSATSAEGRRACSCSRIGVRVTMRPSGSMVWLLEVQKLSMRASFMVSH